MKKWLASALILLVFAGTAYSESKPDGSVQDAYMVKYNKEALSGFERILYPEISGILLTAFKGDMELTVSIEENAAENAGAYLEAYKDGISRYGRVLHAGENVVWNAPVDGEGASVRIKYMYNQAQATDDVYVTDVYAAPMGANKYLVCVFNCWNGEAAEALAEVERVFLSGFGLENVRVSAQYMACVKGAVQNEDGETGVSIDFCSVEYDMSIFTVYAVNNEPDVITYDLRPDALIWSPDPDSALYTLNETVPTADAINEAVDAYIQKNGFDIIYRVVFDENNNIIWMMHYNAF